MDAPPSGTFGDVLRRHRGAAGLTQEELAERARLSPRAISDLERGARNRPWRETIQLLADALRLDSSGRAQLEAAARRSSLRSSSGALADRARLDARLPRTNLPVALTSFVGRERELVEVKGLLAGTRLLTLTGTGGCGKTRLALQVAADIVDAYPDGVWLVELASLADPELVPAAIAAALGVREGSGQPILTTLLSHLRARHLLLLLDNCEHLMAACASIASALLRACPAVRVLATSREALRIDGEVSWSVPSLGLPATGRTIPLAELAASEAGQLFLARARATQPDLVVGDRDAPVVAQICRRLDGIPLALELAATRVKVLSVEQIAARLAQRFRLLTGGSRAALPRHRTLAALVGWSYDLLSEAERTLFNRLAVFAGGFTLDAAEAVCGDGAPGAEPPVVPGPPSPVPPEDVLDVLSELVEKSLVVAEPEPEGRKRYRLLETLRQYGQERLAASGEMETLRERHATHYRDLALAAEPHLLGREQLIDLARLDRERDNLRAALRWHLDHTRAQEGLRLQLGLLCFWWFRGRVTELHLWIDRFLALPEAAERTALRAVALGWAGHGAALRGDQPAFRRLAEQAVALAREVGDRRALAETLLRSGHFADSREAPQLFEESLALWRQLGDRWNIAECLAALGHVAGLGGNLQRARPYLHESLAIARGIGERHATAFALEVLGGLETGEDPVGASARLAESQTLYRELGDLMGTATTEYLLGRLDCLNGRYGSARDHFRVCLLLSRDCSWVLRMTEAMDGLALVAVRQGEPERALRLAGAGAHLRRMAIGLPSPPDLLRELADGLELAKSALGHDAAKAIWVGGQAMTLEQAIAYALGEADG